MIKRMMKIELPQIKGCKLDQYDDDYTIGILMISKFIFFFLRFRCLGSFFFFLNCHSLCNLISIGIPFSDFVF